MSAAPQPLEKLLARGLTSKPMTWADFARAMDALHAGLATNAGKIEKRLQALEARSLNALSYEGVYRPGVAYKRGSAVTHGGSLWVSTRSILPEDTAGPGGRDGSWILAVKRGRGGAGG